MYKLQVLYLFIIFTIFSIILLIYNQNFNTIKIRKFALDLLSTSEETTKTMTSTRIDPNDYARLINLKNFKFLNMVECSTNGNYPFLLIAVHTAPENVENRQTIRETWGMNTIETKLLFMVGVPKKQEDIHIIADEQKKYKDIIQGNFIDSYKNLSYKHVMVLKYTVYHCPKIKYLLKTDDDVFINTPALLTYIQNYKITGVKTSKLLYCSPMFGSPAIRVESKWKVTFEEFPGESYPPYCSGFVELFTPDTVLRIYRKSQISKYFWIDDVFVTGIAREAAKIIIVPFPDTLLLSFEEMETILRINNTYPNIFYSFLVGPIDIDTKQIRDLWYTITHRKKV